MADDDDDEKGKRPFDISKISEDHLSASERLAAEFDKLNPSLSAVTKAYEASGLANLSDIIDASGIGAVQRALDATGVGAVSKMMQEMDVTGARALADATRHLNMSAVDEVARLARGMDLGGINAAVQRIIDIDVMAGSAVGRLARDLETGVLEQAMRAVGIYRVQDLMRSFDLGGIGNTFAEANLALGIGLPSTFGSDFQSAVASLSAQAQVLSSVGLRAQSAVEAFGLSNLEMLLNSAVEVYENLPDEDAATVPNAQTESWYVRRREALRDIITVLMFIIAVAAYVQSLDRSEVEAIEANTAVLTGIRESVDALAAEMETARQNQEAEAERQTEADAEIAEILRGISDALREPDKDDK